MYQNDRYINFIHILSETSVIYVLGENTFISYSTKLVSNKVGQVRLISWPCIRCTLVEMGGMMDLEDSALLKNLSSVDNLTNHLSLQCSSWGLVTAHHVGCESHIVPKD